MKPPVVSSQPAEAIVSATGSKQALRSYVGTYVAGFPNHLKVWITVEEGQLSIEITGQPKTPLIPGSETKFFPAGLAGCWVEFVTNKTGTVDNSISTKVVATSQPIANRGDKRRACPVL